MEKIKTINSSQRSFLSGKANRLNPLVMIGKNGFSDKIISAVNEALNSHELIKVKFIDQKDDRQTISRDLSEKTKSLLVRVIGNIAVLFRQKDKKEERIYNLPS